jgi:hypothetical protein
MNILTHTRLMLVFLLVVTIAGVPIFVGASVAEAVPATAPAVWQQCNVKEVAVIAPERIHLMCEPSVAGLTFFAVPLQSAAFSSQAVSIGATAVANNKRVRVLFDPTDRTTGPTFGCDASDCRPLLGLTLNK